MNKTVRIAVDQTANIDPTLKERLGIETLPLHITNLPREIEERLNKGDYHSFYEYLDKSKAKPQPGTKAGSFYEIRSILERMVVIDDCDIICFVVSGRLSAIYDNTMQAAQELMRQYHCRIAVIGEQAFLSLELLALAAAEFAKKGNGFEEVLRFVDDKRHRAFVWGTLLDLRRLRRSGRVQIPKLAAAVVQPFLKTFRVMPAFILEGDQPRMTKLVKKGSWTESACATIRERVGFQEPVLVKIEFTGAEMPEEVGVLKDALGSQKDFILARPVAVGRASPVVGTHAGSALIAFGVVGLGYDSISTPVLLRFFETAQEELKTFRRVTNAINVFPVRDGDTGSNLLSPLTNVTEGIEPNLPLPAVLNQIVTRIARRGGGYSGGALSAYFLGFNTAVQELEKGESLHLETLIAALAKGTDRCYEYFGKDAKEGTILSVMRACDRAAKQAFAANPTFRNVLSQAYLAATDELLNPRVQEVEILKEQQMVDAGGFGFTLLLWALLRTLGLSREARLKERYRLVLAEVRRHAELGQRLIYRRQPEELRGFCVEGCVQGEVKEMLRAEFLKLDNRLSDAKMTFNEVDNTTHFHIHVSEGLEEEVQRIASRFGYALPPKPPTRLAKRRREIYQFRFVNLFSGIKKIPGYLAIFFGNWVLYALLFPIMWARQHHRLNRLQKELTQLHLVRLALSFISREFERDKLEAIIVLDGTGNIVFSSDSTGAETIERLFPVEVSRRLKVAIDDMSSGHQPHAELVAERWRFEIQSLVSAGQKGYLVKYRQIKAP
ncbi:MAG: DegV family protein [candidate division WOR-3 bacterium]